MIWRGWRPPYDEEDPDELLTIGAAVEEIMPRRYNPEIEEEWYSYEPQPTRTAEMIEAKGGKWVPYEVFKDETNRLRAQIERLKK